MGEGMVQFAGGIRTDAEGRVLWFCNISGHYATPKAYLERMRKYFEEHGVDLSAITIKTY